MIDTRVPPSCHRYRQPDGRGVGDVRQVVRQHGDQGTPVEGDPVAVVGAGDVEPNEDRKGQNAGEVVRDGDGDEEHDRRRLFSQTQEDGTEEADVDGRHEGDHRNEVPVHGRRHRTVVQQERSANVQSQWRQRGASGGSSASVGVTGETVITSSSLLNDQPNGTVVTSLGIICLYAIWFRALLKNDAVSMETTFKPYRNFCREA